MEKLSILEMEEGKEYNQEGRAWKRRIKNRKLEKFSSSLSSWIADNMSLNSNESLFTEIKPEPKLNEMFLFNLFLKYHGVFEQYHKNLPIDGHSTPPCNSCKKDPGILLKWKNPPSALISAFVWAKTPEGHAFWFDLYTKWGTVWENKS